MGLFSRKPKPGREVKNLRPWEQVWDVEQAILAADAEAEQHYARGLDVYARSRNAPGTLIEHMDPEPFEASVATGTLRRPLIGEEYLDYRVKRSIRGHFGHPAQFMLGVLAHDRGDGALALNLWSKQAIDYAPAGVVHALALWEVEARESGTDDETTRSAGALRRFIADRLQLELLRFHIPTNPAEAEASRHARLSAFAGLDDIYSEEAERYDTAREKRFENDYLSRLLAVREFLDGEVSRYLAGQTSLYGNVMKYEATLKEEWRDAERAQRAHRTGNVQTW